MSIPNSNYQCPCCFSNELEQQAGIKKYKNKTCIPLEYEELKSSFSENQNVNHRFICNSCVLKLSDINDEFSNLLNPKNKYLNIPNDLLILLIKHYVIKPNPL